jgi:hypothetical protein
LDGTVAGGSVIFVVVVIVVVVASVDAADDDDNDDGGDDVDNALMRVTSKSRELIVSRGFAVLADQTRQESNGDDFLSNIMVYSSIFMSWRISWPLAFESASLELMLTH